MSKTILKTENISKVYKNQTVLNKVNIELEKGEIYALVGRNGAGKTTLLRTISGQSIPTTGKIQLFGSDSLDHNRKKTGFIIETPGFFPNLSARKNLEYYRIQRGIPGRMVIDDVLCEVGLIDAADQLVREYSLGMKQRLGLALALMGHPAFLILDEPINGLDPIGIMEIRNLLLKLNREMKMTILITSHILAELMNLATRVGFIEKGRIIEEITHKELVAKSRTFLEVVVDKQDKAIVALEKEIPDIKYEVHPNGMMKIYGCNDKASDITELLIHNKIKVYSFTIKGMDLEEYFMALIGGENND